uniref:Family with sequence similarity 219 member A n=1 Tax=Pseudonaja textilis TaxID=8673 RepID=A0A670Z3N9_PSETE
MYVFLMGFVVYFSALQQDPAAASISDRDCDPREGETVAMNYKPSPLQVKLEKQRELARKGSLKNGTMGSPVNQQPKKTNVMARTSKGPQFVGTSPLLVCGLFTTWLCEGLEYRPSQIHCLYNSDPFPPNKIQEKLATNNHILFMFLPADPSEGCCNLPWK